MKNALFILFFCSLKNPQCYSCVILEDFVIGGKVSAAEPTWRLYNASMTGCVSNGASAMVLQAPVR